MAQIEVGVFQQGREIERVTRPIRHVGGRTVVKYKRRYWPLIDGDQIYLDSVSPRQEQCNSDVSEDSENESVPEFQAVPPALIEWDKSQRDVIDSPHQDRLLVGAGPGTGKTAVACGRVSHLIDLNGLESSRIWLISFTRTAVQEIRERIAAHLEDASAAYAVKIATLDSHAWSIHSGFDEGAQILGSYEENIERVLELVREDDSVAEYLEGIEHLVIDEAQDFVGIRSDLVIEIVRKLSPSCGVTVFADEAQAIYDFSDDREDPAEEHTKRSFPKRIRDGVAGVFQERELTTVHRTTSRRLLTIFSDTRRKVLTAAEEGTDRLTEIREEIIGLSHGKAPKIDGAALAELEDAFILYRRRCDVLLTSSVLTKNGVVHRVRMSGLPVCLMPWIGAVLSEHTEPDINRNTFENLWADRLGGTSLANCEVHSAWASLVRIAGRTETVLDLRLLRQRLGRKQPPTELCHSELGHRGPIVGTIHASKGREVDTVHLMLPPATNKNSDHNEEARVAFVGATRGRSRLLVGSAYRQNASRVEASGRAYSLKTRENRPRAQVEVGRDFDISMEGLAGRTYFPNTSAVRTGQARICGLAEESVPLVAESDRSAGFAYRLREDGQGECLAVLSNSVNTDLFAIADAVQSKIGGGRRRPPDKIRHLHLRGVRTVVLPPDAPECAALHEPWRSSGIMVAPLIQGYSTLFFPSWNRRPRRRRA